MFNWILFYFILFYYFIIIIIFLNTKFLFGRFGPLYNMCNSNNNNKQLYFYLCMFGSLYNMSNGNSSFL